MHDFSHTQTTNGEVQALAQAINDEVLVCENKHREMTQKLDDLTTPVSSLPQTGAQSAAYLIASLRSDIASLEESRTSIYEAIPPAYRRSEKARALTNATFAISELLEHILLQLGVPEVLTAQRVSSSFCDAIEGSVVIQRKLGLRPADASQPITFPTVELIPSFDLWFESFHPDSPLDQVYTLSDNEVLIQAQWRTAQKFKSAGSTVRRMLVCQPPVTSMDVYASCRENNGPRTKRRLAATLNVATGITIGHMVDASPQVVKEHKLCAHATLSEHGKDGCVRPSLTLEAIVQVPDWEPVLLEGKTTRESDNDWADEEKEFSARMTPYLTAKRAADVNGDRIPSLEEFEAAQGSQ
ncbi:hypothetical protein LTR85_008412 [Meristemomyces frigidus]|nr:hypothetical protein LTR85_008412 [Meristemomyces frigidus]